MKKQTARKTTEPPNDQAPIPVLIAKANMCDEMYDVLKNYVDDPCSTTQLQELCVKANADDTLDHIMDMAGVDSLDELEDALKIFKEYRITPRYPGKDLIADCKTTEAFWDCECKDNYIHPANEPRCDRCGCSCDEQPDSRVEEVKEMLLKKAVGELEYARLTNYR